MAKNLIPEIAKMLGVELGEEFKIEGNNRIYKFDLNGLHSEHCEMESVALWAIVCGDMEVVKLLWKPNLNERYWTFMSSLEGRKLYVLNYMWDNSVIDVALHKVGWVYRTQEEAKSALPAVAKELGVEYEL